MHRARVGKAADPRELWRKAEAEAKRRKLEDKFAYQLKACRLPTPVREHRFHPERHWRFDFAWVEHLVAVEIDGGTLGRGRHVRPDGFECDAEKLNAAQALGWRVFRYTASQVHSGVAVIDLKVHLERAAWNRREE
jgi:very-short-patch-repair endonuclease